MKNIHTPTQNVLVDARCKPMFPLTARARRESGTKNDIKSELNKYFDLFSLSNGLFSLSSLFSNVPKLA